MEVANILNPALARGAIRVIGATTIREYRQCEAEVRVPFEEEMPPEGSAPFPLAGQGAGFGGSDC